jgi:hypothetical protein
MSLIPKVGLSALVLSVEPARPAFRAQGPVPLISFTFKTWMYTEAFSRFSVPRGMSRGRTVWAVHLSLLRTRFQRKVLTSLLFCPAQAKHEAFLVARGRHYSNEAEAMKRAQELIAAEDEDAEDSQGSMELDNDADEDAPRTRRSKVPPVPPLPSNVNGVGK